MEGMEWLAVAIVFSTILLLVDRNQKWKWFWRVAGTLVLLAAVSFGYLFWQSDQEAKKWNAAHPVNINCSQGDVFDQVACEDKAK